MAKFKPHPLPHLVGAMKLESHPGMNLCVHRTAGFVLDTPGAVMCFGTFDPGPEDERGPFDSDVPFIHCWPEWKGKVWAVSTIERNRGIFSCPVDEYYKVNRARDIKRLDRPTFLKLAKSIGLSRHLRLGVPTKGNASVGGTFLDAAGVKHRSGPDGGILPEVDNG